MFRLKPDIPKRAVAYYRHSAEDKQDFSVPLQRERTEKFAAENGIEIIHEEKDEGVSGLTANRPGFKRLFEQWVTNPNAPAFQFVIILDETRWGRFQDLDEAATYRRLCTKHGKELIRVMRGITAEKDRLASSIVTAVEGFEGARFSERLSEKVSYGSLNIAKQGYSVGGTACYGLARLLLDESKQPKGILKKGEHKAISNQRVTFVPANNEDTEIVKEIFDRFVNTLELPQEIADGLNQRNVLSPSGGAWKSETIHRILDNEAYIGTLIYNRTSNKLKRGHKQNPKEEWVIVADAFPRIIERRIFEMARERLHWMIPAQRRQGLYAVTRAKQFIQVELKKLLLEKGVREDDLSPILRDIPIVFGVSLYRESNSARWCFLVSNEMRKYQFALAIGVLQDKKNPIDRVFLVPTKEFYSCNFHIFSEKDGAYQKYYLKDEEIEAKILGIAKEMGIVST